MNNKFAGFTLIELLVGIMMLVIVMTLAIPSMQSTIQNNRITATTNDLVASLNFARSEAIKRGVSVSICPSADEENYDACGNNTWSNGWLIFVNPDEDNTFDNNAQEPLLRVHMDPGQGLNISTSPVSSVATYNSSGFAASGTGNLTFTLNASGCTANSARTVTINFTGRISTTAIACP